MGRGLGASTKRGTLTAVGVISSLGCDLSLLGLGQVQSGWLPAPQALQVQSLGQPTNKETDLGKLPRQHSACLSSSSLPRAAGKCFWIAF